MKKRHVTKKSPGRSAAKGTRKVKRDPSYVAIPRSRSGSRLRASSRSKSRSNSHSPHSYRASPPPSAQCHQYSYRRPVKLPKETVRRVSRKSPRAKRRVPTKFPAPSIERITHTKEAEQLPELQSETESEGGVTPLDTWTAYRFRIVDRPGHVFRASREFWAQYNTDPDAVQARYQAPKIPVESDADGVDGPIPNSWDLLPTVRVQQPTAQANFIPLGYARLVTSWTTYQKWCLHRSDEELVYYGMETIFGRYFNPDTVQDATLVQILRQFWHHVNNGCLIRTADADPLWPPYLYMPGHTNAVTRPDEQVRSDVDKNPVADPIHWAQAYTLNNFVQIFLSGGLGVLDVPFINGNFTQPLAAQSARSSNIQVAIDKSMPLPPELMRILMNYVGRSVYDPTYLAPLAFDEMRTATDAKDRERLLDGSKLVPFSLHSYIWEDVDSWNLLDRRHSYHYFRLGLRHRPTIDTIGYLKQTVVVPRAPANTIDPSAYIWPGITVVYGQIKSGKTGIVQAIFRTLSQLYVNDEPWKFVYRRHMRSGPMDVSRHSDPYKHLVIECDSKDAIHHVRHHFVTTWVTLTNIAYVFRAESAYATFCLSSIL